jgi:hypothetical protein
MSSAWWWPALWSCWDPPGGGLELSVYVLAQPASRRCFLEDVTVSVYVLTRLDSILAPHLVLVRELLPLQERPRAYRGLCLLPKPCLVSVPSTPLFFLPLLWHPEVWFRGLGFLATLKPPSLSRHGMSPSSLDR